MPRVLQHLNQFPLNQLIEDQIVIRVLSRFSERSQVGINKYKTTLERTDLSTLEWLTHAQEEAMDFVLYLERLKDEYRGSLLTKMVKQSEEDGLYEENVKRTMPK